ncbi:hypothetical protein V5F38_05285 [Xanthobacter sp. V0B-10]|uniref:hypothetical protein n=1 Tax=Xanthobacter albus TaxID=3119929 RepID=UPI00372A150A
MTSKHTQGPWYAVGGMVEIDNDYIQDICSVDPATFFQDSILRKKRSWEEIEANARLIAAAPEMLALLRAIVANHGKEAVQTHLDNTDLADALAAIAKAEAAE